MRSHRILDDRISLIEEHQKFLAQAVQEVTDEMSQLLEEITQDIEVDPLEGIDFSGDLDLDDYEYAQALC